MSVGRLRRFAPGVRASLVGVALVPVAGVALVSADLIADASRQADRADAITGTTTALNDAIRLESEITVESYAANAYASVAERGIPVEVVAQLTELDLEAQFGEATARVDQLLDAADFDDTERLLARARGLVRPDGGDSESIGAAYGSVGDSVGEHVHRGLRTLDLLAAGASDAEELTRGLRALELADHLREDVAAMTESFFRVRFVDGPGRRLHAARLLRDGARYEQHLAELGVLIDSDEELAQRWERISADPAVSAFFDRVDELTDSLVATGADGATPEGGGTEVDIASETQGFLDSLRTITLHAELADAAASEVSAAAEQMRADANASKRQTTTLAVAMGAAALIAAAVASWWIIRPLRRMGESVGRLRQGHLDRVREAGPNEVRDVARALNEAVDHLTLAQGQAMALAEADLDSPVLAQEAPGRLGESLQRAVGALARSLAEREEFRQRLAHEAAHDGLTGLSNRSSTMAHLSQSLARVRRTHHDLAVLFIDIDGFKSVNDQHGHAAGDRVLRTMATRISESIRHGDQLGRLGGDEFVVIAEPVSGLHDALALAERILETTSVPIQVGQTELVPSVSIGVAIAGDGDLTPDEILRDADLAVYKAKSAGRARIEVCDEGLKTELAHRLQVERSLRQGIDNDELELVFQPIADRNALAVAAEALVRWRRNPEALQRPADFIPVAERTDLIIDVDRWVLARAAEQMSAWASEPELATLPVAVNLSARHLGARTLVADVLGPLESNGIDPSRLIVEITESALLDDFERAGRALAELRRHGVQVAIDDFGTGYTSLSHLRLLPVDVLKIDRSFIHNLDNADDRSLVRLIIETGHLLGMTITAEGVETPRQARELCALGADRLQGYVVGRPLPATEVSAAVRRLAQMRMAASKVEATSTTSG